MSDYAILDNNPCDEDARLHLPDAWSFCAYCGQFLTWADRAELGLT